jgi:gamma-glutamyltranspeptidase/glutathione hydrolase
VKGAIAAGHPLTAEAGARMLREGGNAVDACLAAAFVSWVAESPLTGPGGGGFLLVHRARDGRSRLLDFFVTVPGAGLGGTAGEMDTIDIDFDGSTTQSFGIGAASVAVPGTVAGLEVAHRVYGRADWASLFEPAIQLAREGVELNPGQAYLHRILDVILRHTEAGQAIYGPDGECLAAGERIVMPDLAHTLELLAEGGASVFYDGPLAEQVTEHVGAHGGWLTRDDLRGYRVIWRRPIDASFRGHLFVSNPPPSSGGILIAYGLRLLDRVGLGGQAGTADAVARLVGVMREQALARAPGFAGRLHGGGLARQLCAEENIAVAAARLERGPEPMVAVQEPPEPSRTTHISVVDAAGNAASLTASTGSGSGVVVPGTGVHLNNMLGEHHLNLSRRRRRPGGRLTSLMAPSMVLRDGVPRLVVGSAGSARLRGAIMQIVVNAAGHGLPVAEAIEAPRVHLDDGHVHCEGGVDPAELEELERRGYEVVRWRRRNLYFGGAAAVEMTPAGTLAAAGDPRRGGSGVVVDA